MSRIFIGVFVCCMAMLFQKAICSAASDVVIQGMVESTTGGFKFPDGTIATTAVAVGTGNFTATGYFALPNTTSPSTGVLTLSGNPFLHDFGATTNSFVGGNAGGAFTATGAQNTAVGYQSLYWLSTGSNNSAFGYGSMFATTTGYGNSAFGSASLTSNTTGYLNSAFGRETLLNNTTGYGNSAFGYEALYSNNGNLNSAFGIQALVSNTTGVSNNAFGANALWSNTTGLGNTAIGNSALTAATTANGNIAVGDTALGATTTGNNNAALGFHALWKNTTASGNDAFGYYALSSNTTGQYNTGVGDTALGSTTTGNYNTALGRHAGLYNTTGSNNIYLGFNAGPDVSHAALTNTIAIGANALVSQNNTMILGGAGANAVNVGIGTSTPGQALSVVGTIESTTGGFKFPDATTQTTAGISQTAGDARYLQLTGGTMNTGSSGVTINASASATSAGLTVNSSNTSQYGIYINESGYNGLRVDGTMSWANIYSVNTNSGSAWGVSGIADSASGSGVTGSSNNGWGVVARTTNGMALRAIVNSGGTGVAGDFTGNVAIHGTLSKTAGSFQIDHPLDPEHKYLNHSFVESPDMKNIYDGVVVLDANGAATITLPDWFGALNKDFRYQLTPIGAPGPNLHIAQEIANNMFAIAGGAAGLKVSWMVTGIRQDAYANAHRIPVEEDKPAAVQGKFLHPELFGAPASRSIVREPDGAGGVPDVSKMH